MYDEVSPYNIREELIPRYNCRIKQVPLGARDIEIKIKKLIKVKKLFNLIPFNEYEVVVKRLHIDDVATIRKVYGSGRVEQSDIEVAYDIDSDTLYWRYLRFK